SSWPGISPGVRKWDSGPGMRRVEAAMLALVVIWGVNFPIVKIAFREMTPMVFNALRFGSATVLLLAVSWRTREPLPPRAVWPGLVGLGIIGHAIYQISFINGLALTTAGNSALILSMVPLFIAALTSLLRMDRVAPRTWIGIVFAFAGLLLQTGWRHGPGSASSSPLPACCCSSRAGEACTSAQRRWPATS